VAAAQQVVLADDVDEVELGEVLVADLDAPLVRLLFGEEVAGVDADEGAFGDVVQAAQAPALAVRLEELQAH